MMSEVDDSSPTPDCDFTIKGHDIAEMKDKTEDLEIKQFRIQPRQYKHNLLTNAQKSLVILEYQSLVDFVETDGEYIISAGRDHDINVWDAVEGRHIRRLSGHSGPVTGLHLYDSGKTPSEKVIVSSSEDGTIRLWSLNKGEELNKFETENLITCMGVINNIISVSGNHKGYMEVRHLSTGDLYSTILAHMDPIDAIAVEGNYACSATFDSPSCLKVWEIQFEQTTCIYRIENVPEIEFSSVAIWNTTVVLGASDEQKLHIVNFKTDEKGLVDLERAAGKVQHVRVWNNWILSCSACKTDVVLDVHRIDNYEHFGTFCSNMQQVFAIAAMESDSSLKIVLGGSALAVLGFHFNLMQEDMNIPFKKVTKCDKSSLIHFKKRSHFTLNKTTADECPGEKSTDSDESSSEDEAPYKPHTNISVQRKSDFYSKVPDINTNCSTKRNAEYRDDMTNSMSNKSLMLSEMPFMMMSMHSHMPFIAEKFTSEHTPQYPLEPRVAVRKLEKLLDENNQLGELEECVKSNGNHGTSKEIIDNILKKYTENTAEDDLYAAKGMIEEKTKFENDCEITSEVTANETQDEKTHLFKENINEINTENFEHLTTIHGNACGIKLEQGKNRFYLKKNRKSKSEMKKTEKQKHKRCEIM